MWERELLGEKRLKAALSVSVVSHMIAIRPPSVIEASPPDVDGDLQIEGTAIEVQRER
jgi:hypothetical protein